VPPLQHGFECVQPSAIGQGGPGSVFSETLRPRPLEGGAANNLAGGRHAGWGAPGCVSRTSQNWPSGPLNTWRSRGARWLAAGRPAAGRTVPGKGGGEGVGGVQRKLAWTAGRPRRARAAPPGPVSRLPAHGAAPAVCHSRSAGPRRPRAGAGHRAAWVRPARPGAPGWSSKTPHPCEALLFSLRKVASRCWLGACSALS